MKTKSSLIVLSSLLLLCYLIAFLGSLATLPAIPTWYATLAKPSWTPPNWLFGPVWTALYTMMAVAAWRIIQAQTDARKKRALVTFAVQLAFNALWSPLFFGGHQIAWGLVVILFLWLAILATLIQFWRLDKMAGGLLIPYWLWVSYALTLNAGDLDFESAVILMSGESLFHSG